jgi:hypothetical protein
LSWDIETRPVSFQKGGQIISDENYKLITRNDTDSVLSVMSKNYVPMTNEDFMESTQRMVEVSGMPLVGFQEFMGGKVVFGVLKNNQENFKVGQKYPIEDYLILGSSFNGEKPFFVGTSTILLRCMNAFSRINILETVRHTKNGPQRRETLFQYVETYMKQRTELYSKFDLMLEQEVKNIERDLFVKQVLGIPILPEDGKDFHKRTQTRIEGLTNAIEGEMKDLGNNVFGLFQGVTKYTTHDLKTRNGGPFGNIMGTANEINQRAIQLCSKMVQTLN